MENFFKFSLGKYVAGKVDKTQSPLFHRINRNIQRATENIRLLQGEGINEEIATDAVRNKLDKKSTVLDLVMYYDQVAATFLIGALQVAKTQIAKLNGNENDDNRTASIVIDWITASIPLAVTLTNTILKKVRDTAIAELPQQSANQPQTEQPQAIRSFLRFNLGAYAAGKIKKTQAPFVKLIERRIQNRANSLGLPLGDNLEVVKTIVRNELDKKASVLDLVMYYDQVAATFIVAALQVAKTQIAKLDGNENNNNATASIVIDWVIASIPLALTLTNTILKKVRDTSIVEMPEPPAADQAHPPINNHP